MAQSPREIKRRIKSVKNIGQITKAMELVSAAKMRRAQAQATASRPYARLSAELLKNLIGNTSKEHELINKVIPESHMLARKALVILITSDSGLAGAFNANVINKALGLLKNEGIEKFDFISVGRKGADFLKRMNAHIIAAFDRRQKSFTFEDAKPIAEVAVRDYLADKYEKVFIIYTDFISTLVQKPNMIQLLPFVTESAQGSDILIEPDPDAVLDQLIYKTIDFTVYQALVESSASEHSARMVAMKNANEAAHDLMDELTLSYNQARQAGITRELAEISAAKLALE